MGQLFDFTGMMTEKDVEEILRRYLHGSANEQEVKWVEQWYTSMEQHNNYPELDEDQKRDIVYASYAKIQSKIKADRTKFVAPWPALAAAAVIIMAIVSIYNLTPDPVQSHKGIVALPTLEKLIKNETSLVKNVLLTDSTKVALQPNSSIRIADNFNQHERKVFLEGEAFFNVSHDPSKPFYVEAQEVVTKVLGTSFTIRAYDTDKNITVKVKTGKVSVYSGETKNERKDKKPVILTANQQAVYNRAENVVTKAIVENPEILITEQAVRKLKFEAAPMAEVMGEIEKAYGMEIIFSKETFSSCKLTTTLGADGIFNRLDILCRAIGASYTQEDGRIVITGKGCE
jgi:transmembrane sensor